jgi:oligoribonuclease
MSASSSAEKTPVQSASHLAWVDLEMTGLEVETQAILQAAVIITDVSLNVLDEFACDVWQPPSAFSAMSPFVREMHEKNGLLERVSASKTDLADAEQKLLGKVAAWCSYPATLCGNSVWQDRKFIDRYMPGLGRYFGYRMIDVSAVKVLAGRWYGEDAVYVKPKTGAHDALVDIKNSINELKHYRATIFSAERRG